MNRETHIIEVYLTIQSACRAVSGGNPLRRRGPAARLTDAEILTIEIFGEMQGHHDDAAIWRYAKAHWQEWFPGLGSYPAFAKQCANLAWLKQRIFAPVDDVHITDGAPMPICHMARWPQQAVQKRSRIRLLRRQGRALLRLQGCFTQRYVNDRSGSTAFVRDDTTPQAGCSVHLMALQRRQIASSHPSYRQKSTSSSQKQNTFAS